MFLAPDLRQKIGWRDCRLARPTKGADTHDVAHVEKRKVVGSGNLCEVCKVAVFFCQHAHRPMCPYTGHLKQR